jgi:hypothetical protein
MRGREEPFLKRFSLPRIQADPSRIEYQHPEPFGLVAVGFAERREL